MLYPLAEIANTSAPTYPPADYNHQLDTIITYVYAGIYAFIASISGLLLFTRHNSNDGNIFYMATGCTCLVRAVFLGLQADNFKTDVVRVIPSFLFLFVFSVIIYFWIRTYYTLEDKYCNFTFVAFGGLGLNSLILLAVLLLAELGTEDKTFSIAVFGVYGGACFLINTSLLIFWTLLFKHIEKGKKVLRTMVFILLMLCLSFRAIIDLLATICKFLNPIDPKINNRVLVLQEVIPVLCLLFLRKFHGYPIEKEYNNMYRRRNSVNAPDDEDEYVRVPVGPSLIATAEGALMDNDSMQFIQLRNLRFKKRIGFGSTGEVYYAVWNRSTDVAVKTIKVPMEYLDAVSKREWIREIKLLSELSHPNVVQFLGACVTEDNIYLVTEYLPRGSVGDLLAKKPILSKIMIVRIMADTAAGIHYLHNRTPVLVHRDLKPHNLLMTQDGTTKIADFGSAHICVEEFHQGITINGGTPQYSAPELLKKNYSDRRGDVYSFGVILWEMCSGKKPHCEMNQQDVLNAVIHNNIRLDLAHANIYPEFEPLIAHCLSELPSDRPVFEEIIEVLTRFSPDLLDRHVSDTGVALPGTPGGCSGDSYL